MSQQQPSSLKSWILGLPIPWLVSNEVGADDASAQGDIYDEQVSLVRQGVRARLPGVAPADALPYLGQDRKLIQGYAESNDDFRTRCRTAFSQWELAGTWAELLFQLYWSCGLDTSSTWIVQQNGYAYNLTANPGADEDPLPLLNVTPLMDNPTVTYPTPVPWWRFDDRNDLCSRFAIVMSGALPDTICITARAVFDGTSSTVTADWSGPFDNIEYRTMWSLTTTDGSIPFIAVDGSSKTTGTVTVNASAPFVGYVDLLGWPEGANPFAGPSQSTKNLINRVVKTWKPAKAKYMGAFVLVNGVMWGWPLGTTWGQPGLKWGDSVTLYLSP